MRTTNKEDKTIFNLFGNRGKSLNMAQALENMKSDPAIRLVDVRSPEEYREGHIPGSISLPLDSLSRVAKVIPDKDTVIYTYCYSGSRSGAAADMLGRLGYTQVKNIGGISGYHGTLAR